MYESREASESRGMSYPSYFSSSSESRDVGESRIGYYGGASESRLSSSSTPITKKQGDSSIPEKYNNFDDIDTLIEQLEVTIPVLEQLQSRGDKYSKSLQRRKQQIEKLRQIREDRLISEIEKESDAFDEKIDEVKKLTKVPKRVSSYHSSWNSSSESRDSGESRW